MASNHASSSPPPDPDPAPPDPATLFEDVTKRLPTAETSATPPAGAASDSWSGVFGAVVPDRVGNYTITRLIGAGGMGAVFEAIQDQPRRAVALKLLRAGLASPKALVRFQNESDVLARLKHPCIAQIYDAGTHESALGPVPYFAMELVGGPDRALASAALAGSNTAALGGRHTPALNIVDFARQKNLSLAQKLDLMACICDAVQHAHDNRVIHRDLKPDNILVEPAATSVEGRPGGTTGSGAPGLPKIIDFGIARLADPTDSHVGGAAADRPIHTTHGHAVGTLAYMSPEQTLGDPARVDHRTDVYSLGVVMYELLTGVMPYQTAGVGREEGARMVREARPTPPSRHDAALAGDIENVLLKALRRDRGERYQSAGEMRDDLRRVLAGHRAKARKLRAWTLARHGARDWAGKHPVLATLAVMAVAVLGGLWWWQASPTHAPDMLWQRALADIRLPIDDLQKACVIGVDETLDEATIREALDHAGFPDLDPANIRSLRPIYAKFLTEKLARSGAPAVAFDIAMDWPYSYQAKEDDVLRDLPPDPPDAALRDAVALLLERRPPIPVVFAYNQFPRDRIKPISVLAVDDGKARFGSTKMHFSPTGLWWATVFEKPVGADPRPSLSVALCANARYPGYEPSYRWDSRRNEIELLYTPIGVAGAGPDRGKVQRFACDSPESFDENIDYFADGLQDTLPGDLVCGRLLYMPDDACLSRATLSLSKALAISPEALSAWIRGRSVIIANFKDEQDYHPYGRGRVIAGPYRVAVEAEGLSGGFGLTLMSDAHAYAGLALCSVLGVVLAWGLRSNVARSAAAIVFVGVLLAGGALVFSRAHYQLGFPTCLVVCLVIAILLASWVAGVWRARLA